MPLFDKYSPAQHDPPETLRTCRPARAAPHPHALCRTADATPQQSSSRPSSLLNTFNFFEKGVQTKSWTYDVPDWSLHTQQGLACILHFSAFKDWLFCTFPHLSSFVPKEAFGDAIIDVGRHPKSVFARQIRNSGLRATEYPLASVARSPLLREIALETQTKALKRRPKSLFA